MPAFLRSAGCGLVLSLALAGSAVAQADADMVGTRLAEAAAASGHGALTYETATAAGDAVTLANVTVTATDGSTVTVPAIVFSGIVDRPAGGFYAAHVTADGGTAKGSTKTATWTTAAFDEVIVPSADEIKSRAPITPFQRAAIAGASLDDPDLGAPLAIAGVDIALTPAPDGTPTAMQLHATGVKIPASVFANSMAGAIIGMMQYQEFVADVTLDGSYDPATGVANLAAFAFDVPEVGRIGLSGQASAFMLEDIMSTDVETSKAARANARLDTLTLRLDNAGFVERMLDMQARMLGGTPDDVRVQLVGGALPFALSFVKNAAFRTQFLAAVDAFLKDPRSLTISFQPAEPVPLGQVVRTAAREPMTLPDLLSPTVEANK